MKLLYKIILLFGVLLLIGLSLYFLKDYKRLTLFDAKSESSAGASYLHDDFCGYNEYSESLDQMESLDNISVLGAGEDVKLSNNNYGGEKSLEYYLPADTSNQTKVSGAVKSSLVRWSESGVYSAWIHLDDRYGVKSISLSLVSDNGARRFRPMENIITEEENRIKSDDIYPNYHLPEKDNEGNDEWEDYMLSNGWNYLFWRSDEFEDSGDFSIESVDSYQIEINYYDGYRTQSINVDNLRVSDGLQIKKNPLAGNWYAPNGMPQYGVFDVEKGEDECYARLLNVRQKQYPSNGDHVRIISKETTSENFIEKIEFEAVDYQPQNKKNSYFRFQYDFDKEYDPGHDWFGAFVSLEYDKFGLISVEPVERYFVQREEPEEFSNESRKEFSLDFGKRYELNIEVHGQNAKAVLYEVLNGKLFKYKRIREVEYTFERERNVDNNNSFSIEATGAYHMNLYGVDIISLTK